MCVRSPGGLRPLPNQLPGCLLNSPCPAAAGLPFAMNAIFYAEPENSPKVLLQRGMAELLTTANDTGAESWPRCRSGAGGGCGRLWREAGRQWELWQLQD